MDKIDQTFYINLKHRTDRNEEMKKEFKCINFDKFERFEGVFDEWGSVGCVKSHIAVLEKMSSSISMVVEDDLEFLVPREEIDSFINSFINDEKADVLCLAFNARELTKFNDLLYRTTNTQTASCYIIKQRMIPIILDNFKQSLHLLITEESHKPLLPKNSLDQTWKWLQKEYVFVVPMKRCARQRASFSNILQSYVNYGV